MNRRQRFARRWKAAALKRKRLAWVLRRDKLSETLASYDQPTEPVAKDDWEAIHQLDAQPLNRSFTEAMAKMPYFPEDNNLFDVR